MSDPRKRDDDVDTDVPLLPRARAMTPSNNSFFGPEPVPVPDSRGVNEEEVSTDTELLDSGDSPEFDHSLRNRSSGA